MEITLEECLQLYDSGISTTFDADHKYVIHVKEE